MKSTFEFKFHGEEVKDGSIQVDDFAAAALAISTLIQEANKALNGDRAAVSVRLKADPFRPGSFETFIELGLSIVDQAKLLIGKEGLKTSQGLLELLGFWVKADGASGGVLTGGLINFLKALRGQIPQQIKKIGGGTALVVTGDGSHIRIDQSVTTIYNNARAPKALNDALRPLERDGIESLEFSNPAQPLAEPNRITKQDREQFQRIAEQREQEQEQEQEGEDEHISEYELFLKLVSVSFEGDYVWRFTNGKNRITALMKDADFLEQVRGGMAFRSGTLLKVRIKTKTTFTKAGAPSTQHSIIKVLQKRAPPVQQRLLEDRPSPKDKTSDQ